MDFSIENMVHLQGTLLNVISLMLKWANNHNLSSQSRVEVLDDGRMLKCNEPNL